MTSSEDSRHTAIHEAGHAVAFYRLFSGGRIGGQLTIVPVGNNLGSHQAEEVSFPWTEQITLEQQEQFHREAVYACASYAALVAAGYSEDEAEQGCQSDFEKAVRCSGEPLDAVRREAVALMSRAENVRAVARIADELMRRKRLDEDEVTILLEVADGNASEEDYSQYLKLKQ